MKKILLLDINYQFQQFIDLPKALKHIIKEKVDIVSTWEEDIHYSSGKIPYPSILKLKKPIKRNFVHNYFSRNALLKRDNKSCQYCSKFLPAAHITIDHVIPKSRGGLTSFTNCVVACQPCNYKKANRTPEEAQMKLIREPTHPSFSCAKFIGEKYEYWHKDWDNFII